MTDDTPKPLTGIGTIAEVAATMMRAAFAVPIRAMRTACGVQERAIGLMESFVPGLDAGGEWISGQPAPPGARAAAATPSAGTAGATTGWGPVTPQTPATGWGPMPR